MSDLAAPEGSIWVCMACGKTSTRRYGIRSKGAITSPWWDESCMLNCVLVRLVDVEIDPATRHAKPKGGKRIRGWDPEDRRGPPYSDATTDETAESVARESEPSPEPRQRRRRDP